MVINVVFLKDVHLLSLRLNRPKPRLHSIYNMFSIGVAPKNTIRKPKKRKFTTNKKTMVDPSIHFTPYRGYRWQVPSGIQVSNSTRMKFSMFETGLIKTIVQDITNRIKSRISISTPFHSPYNWKPPQQVLSYIQSFKDKQMNEFKKVRVLYRAIFRLIFFLKKCIHIHRVNKSIQNVKNTLDIVTLDTPLKPIYVIDIKRKLSHVYEASTLRRAIETKLLFSDLMFPEVKDPINMYTNQPFTYTQLISITDQCRKYNEFSWVIDRLKSCNYNIKTFERLFQQQLKIEAIHSYFKSQIDYSKDTVLDYFELIASMSSIPEYKILAFSNLITENSRHPYVKRWIALTKRYYIAVELKNTKEIYSINNESFILIKRYLVY